MVRDIIYILALIYLITLLTSCTPTGRAIKEGALTAFLIAQARYCSQPEEARAVVRSHLRSQGVRIEIDCSKPQMGRMMQDPELGDAGDLGGGQVAQP